MLAPDQAPLPFLLGSSRIPITPSVMAERVWSFLHLRIKRLFVPSSVKTAGLLKQLISDSCVPSNPLLTGLRTETFPTAIKHPGEKGGKRVIYFGELL